MWRMLTFSFVAALALAAFGLSLVTLMWTRPWQDASTLEPSTPPAAEPSQLIPKADLAQIDWDIEPAVDELGACRASGFNQTGWKIESLELSYEVKKAGTGALANRSRLVDIVDVDPHQYLELDVFAYGNETSAGPRERFLQREGRFDPDTTYGFTALRCSLANAWGRRPQSG